MDFGWHAAVVVKDTLFSFGGYQSGGAEQLDSWRSTTATSFVAETSCPPTDFKNDWLVAEHHPKMPRTDLQSMVGYSAAENVIWVIGGQSNPQQLVSFDLGSNGPWVDHGQSFFPTTEGGSSQFWTHNQYAQVRISWHHIITQPTLLCHSTTASCI